MITRIYYQIPSYDISFLRQLSVLSSLFKSRSFNGIHSWTIVLPRKSNSSFVPVWQVCSACTCLWYFHRSRCSLKCKDEQTPEEDPRPKKRTWNKFSLLYISWLSPFSKWLASCWFIFSRKITSRVISASRFFDKPYVWLAFQQSDLVGFEHTYSDGIQTLVSYWLSHTPTKAVCKHLH